MAYQDVVLADSPVGYWRLGEASGNFVDSVAGGHDGTIYGALSRAQASLKPLTGAGIYGDGSGSKGVTVGDYSPYNFTGAFSIEFLAKIGFLSSNDIYLLGKGRGLSNVGWEVMCTYFYNTPANTLYLRIGGSGTNRLARGLYLGDNVARHCVVQYDGYKALFWRDGALVDATYWTSGLNPGSASGYGLTIGYTTQYSYAYGPLNQQEVAIYNSFLTPVQIANHYRAAVLAGALNSLNNVAKGDHLRRAPAALSGRKAVAPGDHGAFNLDFSGPGRIHGTVDEEGVAARNRIHLLDRQSLARVKSQMSDAGAYDFRNLRMGREFILLGTDLDNVFNAVVADRVTAEAQS